MTLACITLKTVLNFLKKGKQVLERNEQMHYHVFQKTGCITHCTFFMMRLYQLGFFDSPAIFLVLVTRRQKEVKGLGGYLGNISTGHS